VVDIDHHARPAGVAVRVELRSRYDVADFDVYRAHAVTGLRGLLGRQSDRGGFWVGEEDLRHCVMVGGGRVGAPRRGVQRLACCACRDRRPGDPCLVFALVCQQRSMVRATGYPAMQGRLVEFDRLNQTR
jgi:hypothetical protein